MLGKIRLSDLIRQENRAGRPPLEEQDKDRTEDTKATADTEERTKYTPEGLRL